MKHLSASIEAGHLTNRGPATQRLEAEARRRLKLGRHVAVSPAADLAIGLSQDFSKFDSK